MLSLSGKLQSSEARTPIVIIRGFSFRVCAKSSNINENVRGKMQGLDKFWARSAGTRKTRVCVRREAMKPSQEILCT